MLGTAAGTTPRAYARYLPDTTVDAVEIDGELIDIGRRYFGLRAGPQLRTITEDARPFLRRAKDRYDVIMVDAYRQPYIPFYLTTKEFFELARDRLAPGRRGGHQRRAPRGLRPAGERPLGDAALGVRQRRARPDGADQHDPDGQRRAAVLGQADRGRAGQLDPDLQSTALRRRLAAAARALRGGEVYTDDHAPVEWLVDESLVDYASGG